MLKSLSHPTKVYPVNKLMGSAYNGTLVHVWLTQCLYSVSNNLNIL